MIGSLAGLLPLALGVWLLAAMMLLQDAVLDWVSRRLRYLVRAGQLPRVWQSIQSIRVEWREVFWPCIGTIAPSRTLRF